MSTVTVTGLVKMPDGRSVGCWATADEVRAPGGVDVAYTGFSDIKTDVPVPDGYYEVHFGGQALRMRVIMGRWLAIGF